MERLLTIAGGGGLRVPLSSIRGNGGIEKGRREVAVSSRTDLQRNEMNNNSSVYVYRKGEKERKKERGNLKNGLNDAG